MGTSFSARDNPVDFGVVPRVVEDVFAMIAGRPSEGVRCTVRVSYLEIYNEQVREAVLVAVGAHARARAHAHAHANAHAHAHAPGSACVPHTSVCGRWEQ